jgi:hypothetical protein
MREENREKYPWVRETERGGTKEMQRFVNIARRKSLALSPFPT